jgi:nicotinamidase-related amidase
MQRALFMAGPISSGADSVSANLSMAAAHVRAMDCPVIFVRHCEAYGSHSRGSFGWQWCDGLAPSTGDHIVDKRFSDAFRDTRLRDLLLRLQVKRLLVGGYATELCVDSTARMAAGCGYEVTVLSDGHITNDRAHLGAQQIVAHHNWVWSRLRSPGGAIHVLGLEDALALHKSINGGPTREIPV